METAFPPADYRSLDDHTDAVVAAEAAHRDADAMRVLFQRYKGTVFNIARRILRDPGEAEDVRQQVYFEAFAGIAKFDPKKGSFKNWLLRRALHRSINRRRDLEAEGFYRSEPIEVHPESAIDGETTQLRLLPAELSRLTEELLCLLDSRERQVVKLTFCESYTREEIASHLGITVSAVRHSLKKSLQIMHSALADGRNSKGKDRNGEPRIL